MAGDWIKMRVNLDTDPAVFCIADETGLEPLTVVGHLWKLWSWADQQSIDGHAISVTFVTLDRVVRHAGFAQAMQKAGWLTGQDGSISFPNFERHNGETAKKRGLEAKRSAAYRERHGKSVTRP